MTNYGNSAGPGDGSRSLAKESKFGLATGAVVTFALQAVAQGLSTLDTSDWSGWWVPLATTGVGTVAGLITAWLKKNR